MPLPGQIKGPYERQERPEAVFQGRIPKSEKFAVFYDLFFVSPHGHTHIHTREKVP